MTTKRGRRGQRDDVQTLLTTYVSTARPASDDDKADFEHGGYHSNDGYYNNDVDENGAVDNRNAYSREFKISVLDWHHANGSVKNKTARRFNISHQNVLRWVRTEVSIRNGKKGAKRSGSGRSAMYPLLEHLLHEEFLEFRSKGVKIRNMWFLTR